MPAKPLLYYVTDRTQFPGHELNRRKHLWEKISEASQAAIDYIQLREKDLGTRELEIVALEAMRILRAMTPRTATHRTRLLINSSLDVALAVGADGVHLPSGDTSLVEIRRIAAQFGSSGPRAVTVSTSCHKTEEVHQAQMAGAHLALFAPVFEKKTAPASPPVGLEALRQACQYKIPVLALGGVTLENVAACLEAGAAGIAAIRLFQENKIAEVVRQFRSF